MYDENCADEMTRKKERKKKKVKMKQSSNKRESHGQKTTFHFLHGNVMKRARTTPTRMRCELRRTY